MVGASAPLVNYTVTVTNTGARAGDEVVMALFVPHPGTVPAGAPAARLRKQMFAFERVAVGAGGAKVAVTFAVDADSLELYSAAGDRTVYPGAYTLQFTNGVDATVTKEINVTTPNGAPMTRERLHR